MVKNSGDTQARFLAKSLAVFYWPRIAANEHEFQKAFAADLRSAAEPQPKEKAVKRFPSVRMM
jgi:hypothetical protein